MPAIKTAGFHFGRDAFAKVSNGAQYCPPIGVQS